MQIKVTTRTQIAMISFLICLFGTILIGHKQETMISRIPYAGAVCSFILSVGLFVKDNDY